jgi:hypothetical protein
MMPKGLPDMSGDGKLAAAQDEIMREKIREALNDPRADIPAAEVFAKLRASIAREIESEAQTSKIAAQQ